MVCRDEGVGPPLVSLLGLAVVAVAQVDPAGLQRRDIAAPPHHLTSEDAELTGGQHLGDVGVVAVEEVQVHATPLQVEDHVVAHLCTEKGVGERAALAVVLGDDQVLTSHVRDVRDGRDEAADDGGVGGRVGDTIGQCFGEAICG